MTRPKKPKIRSRYSIGEWYGSDLESLPLKERIRRADVEHKTDTIAGEQCPFQTNTICNKKGGVCSLRLYREPEVGIVQGTGPLITTCPNRFLESGTIFRWVGETLLQTSDPIILGEIGFLDRLRHGSPESVEKRKGEFIGRIDNVLVHPTRAPLDWCALELQAVYFSGSKMSHEFKILSEFESETLPFPARNRRPDWRSSGPKRLLPQLQTKVPTIRTWGKKMAVVIDESFFESLVCLDREPHPSNAEIVWFVVGYDRKAEGGGWTLVKREVVFTKLDASVKSLTGGTPLSKEKFELELKLKLATKNPSHPLGVQGGV